MQGDDQKLIDDLTKRLSSLKNIRSAWMPIWSDCAKHVLPRKASRINETAKTQISNGAMDAKTPSIYDNTATLALRTLSAGMLGGLTSPTKPWFKVSLGNDKDHDTTVKVWLSEVEERMRAVMARSNFYNAIHRAYEDLGLFGTSAMIIYEDYEDVIRCYNIPVGEFLATVDGREEVTVLYREFSMTCHALVDKFGFENCSSFVQNNYKSKGNLEAEVTIVHAIQKNKDFDITAKGHKGKEYIDVYWERNDHNGKFLQKNGFFGKPFCVVRWHANGNDVYGISPTMETLGDIKNLQHDQMRKSQALDLSLAPPMIADMRLKDQGASLLPNGITYMSNLDMNAGMRPIHQVRPDFSGLLEDIGDIRRRVERAFFTDLWMMLDRLEGVQPRSQMELIKREGEKILQLSPVLHRIQNELLDVCIERIFSIMFKGNLFPKLPESLPAGDSLNISYVSGLASAQKATGTGAIEQFVAWIGSVAGAKPEVLDKLDIDAIADKYGQLLDLDPTLLIPTDKANDMRQQRAEQAQQQQMLQNGMALTQGAKTMSETNVGGGSNALQRVLGLGA